MITKVPVGISLILLSTLQEVYRLLRHRTALGPDRLSCEQDCPRRRLRWLGSSRRRRRVQTAKDILTFAMARTARPSETPRFQLMLKETSSSSKRPSKE